MKRLLLCALSLTSSAFGMQFTPGRFYGYGSHEDLCEIRDAKLICDKQGNPYAIRGTRKYPDRDGRSDVYMELAGTYKGMRGSFFALSWQEGGDKWITRIYTTQEADEWRDRAMHPFVSRREHDAARIASGERLIRTRITPFQTCDGCCRALLENGNALIEMDNGSLVTSLVTMPPDSQYRLRIGMYGNHQDAAKDHTGTFARLEIHNGIIGPDLVYRNASYSWNIYNDMLLLCIEDADGIHELCFDLASAQQIALPNTPEALTAMNNVLKNLPGAPTHAPIAGAPAPTVAQATVAYEWLACGAIAGAVLAARLSEVLSRPVAAPVTAGTQTDGDIPVCCVCLEPIAAGNGEHCGHTKVCQGLHFICTNCAHDYYTDGRQLCPICQRESLHVTFDTDQPSEVSGANARHN